MLLGTLIAAGLAGLIGTGVSHIERKTDRDYNAEQAQIQRDYEANQAQIQRDYETEMSNTAVQRQVQDMEKAGINSAMAFSNGASGASTPNGSSARGSAASASSGHTNFSSVINSAANLANSFNYDKNRKNDVTVSDVVKTLSNVSQLFN